MNISEEIIDSFVRGELKGSELDAFNNSVAADPQLQQQVSFQKEIVGSINQFRHQQLKSRLNAIAVKPIGVSLLGSNYAKIAASITAVVILLGSYAIYDNVTSKTKDVVLKNPSSETIANNSSNSDKTTVTEVVPIQTTENLNKVSNTTKSTQGNSIVTPANGIDSKKKPVTTSTKAFESNTQSSVKTDYSDPQMESDNMINGINDNFEMPSMNTDVNSSSVSSPQIKVNIVKENNLGYQFFNNQLFLHGNFSNSTYELLELNNKPSKQLFLYFENNYYELVQGKTKTTPLSPIKDSTVLLQLNQLRAH
ncbi:hypothetical protein [uncultured Cytophaga sp.]|uniref:hypothetical protein n=1 Tax=uncultured Cytophaga sp. TaxID=160238 RepID=UPI00260E4084|nr:hypothetical protein [uncultured Cytophaga sp.]